MSFVNSCLCQSYNNNEIVSSSSIKSGAGSKMENLKGRIVIYSIVGCPHCNAAKSKLSELKLPYVDVSVDRFPSYVRQWLKKKTGKSSVPQIFFNEEYIGGNSELQSIVNGDKEKWEEYLKKLKENDPPSNEDVLLPNPGDAKDFKKGENNEDSKNDKDFDFSCEMDEYSIVVDELLESGILKNHKTGIFSSIKDSFSGSDFVDWIVDKKEVTRERGVEMGQELINRKFGRNSNVNEEVVFKDCPKSIYQLIMNSTNGLNYTEQMTKCVQRPASEISEDIRKLILSIFADHLSSDGRYVDYEGIKSSANFESYKKLTAELQRVNLEKLNDNEKLAFFINIYNACVIHGNVEKGIPSNTWQRYKFFSTIGYNLGGDFYSLNDMENGVLRGNRGSMATLYQTPFRKSDPRLKIAMKNVDGRIHFALNCGAKSCPPIKTFCASDIQNQLKLATEAFLENDDAITIDSDHIHLIMLFKWYHIDFGSNREEVLKWIVDHMDDDNPKKQTLRDLLDLNKYKVKYLTYDWGNNSKD